MRVFRIIKMLILQINRIIISVIKMIVAKIIIKTIL